MTKTVYVCGVTWSWEMGETSLTVYQSVKALKKAETCWRDCGIAALTVSFEEWEQEPRQLCAAKPRSQAEWGKG